MTAHPPSTLKHARSLAGDPSLAPAPGSLGGHNPATDIDPHPDNFPICTTVASYTALGAQDGFGSPYGIAQASAGPESAQVGEQLMHSRGPA
jgi:hypothetical protein